MKRRKENETTLKLQSIALYLDNLRCLERLIGNISCRLYRTISSIQHV